MSDSVQFVVYWLYCKNSCQWWNSALAQPNWCLVIQVFVGCTIKMRIKIVIFCQPSKNLLFLLLIFNEQLFLSFSPWITHTTKTCYILVFDTNGDRTLQKKTGFSYQQSGRKISVGNDFMSKVISYRFLDKKFQVGNVSWPG